MSFNNLKVFPKNHYFFTCLIVMCIFYSVTTIASDTNEYLSASKKFQSLVSKQSSANAMLTMKDKSVAKLILTLSNSKRFLDAKQYDDIRTISSICGAANKARMAYKYHRIDSITQKYRSNPTILRKMVQARIGKNTLQYQNELALLSSFSIRCMAKHMPLLTKLVVGLVKSSQMNAIRRKGLKRVQQGIATLYQEDMSKTISSQQYSESYRLSLASAMSDVANVYAGVVSIATRKAIINEARRAKKTSGRAYQKYLDNIISAMQSVKCEGLCAL